MALSRQRARLRERERDAPEDGDLPLEHVVVVDEAGREALDGVLTQF